MSAIGISPCPPFYKQCYSPELITYITGLATPLSAGQKAKLNVLINDIKAATGVSFLSDAFDLIYVLAGETQESSLKNLVKNNFHGVLSGAPAFVALEGFTGGAAKYIKTSFLPAANAIRATLNDESHGCYIRQAVEINVVKIVYGTYNALPAGTQIYMTPSYSNHVTPTLNDGLGSDGNYKEDYAGFYCGVRTAAAITKTYINYLKFSGTRASVALPTKELYLLCRNLDGVAGSWYDKQVSFMFLGKSFTENQMYGIMSAFEKYMTANGKNILRTSIGIVGDSIADIFTTIYAWASNFLQASYTVADYAVTGHSIILHSATDAALLTGNVYDKIIMGWGTNDNDAGDMAARQAEVEAAIVSVKASCPKATIYYMNILPRWTDATGVTEVPKGNLRVAIAAACAAQGITCWDTYTIPWLIAANTTDGCHPTAAGATIIYNEILARI